MFKKLLSKDYAYDVKTVIFFIKINDIFFNLLFGFTSFFVYYLNYSSDAILDFGLPANYKNYYVIIFLYTLFQYIFLNYFNLYKNLNRNMKDDFIQIIKSTICSIFTLSLIGFLFQIQDQFSRGYLIIFFTSATIFINVIRVFIYQEISKLKHLGFFRERVLLIGNETDYKKNNIDFNLNIISLVKQINLKGLDNNFNYENLFKTIKNLIDSKKIDSIYFLGISYNDKQLEQILLKLKFYPIKVSFIINHLPSRINFDISKERDLALINYKFIPNSVSSFILKRLEDLSISIFLIILLSPILIIISILIKLSSKGPIFFKQEREGLNGNLFLIYKFRTLKINENANNYKQIKKNDLRVTTIGKYLRKFSIDELPQLFNVFKGEMSIVGPRPHNPKMMLDAITSQREDNQNSTIFLNKKEHYLNKFITNYSSRHRVKPGITGLAQINGYRGETKTVAELKLRVQKDLEYIDNWSLYFDLYIILRTIFIIFYDKNSY